MKTILFIIFFLITNKCMSIGPMPEIPTGGPYHLPPVTINQNHSAFGYPSPWYSKPHISQNNPTYQTPTSTVHYYYDIYGAHYFYAVK